MGLVDTAVVGRLTATNIAGVSLGNAIFFLVTILGTGILMALDPLVSQATGAQQHKKARGHLNSGMVLALLLCIPLTLALFASWAWVLPLFGIKPHVQQATYQYLLGRAPGVLFYFFFITMRCYLQSVSMTRPIVVMTVIANVANIPISIFLALGDNGLTGLGLPAVGFAGWGVLGAAVGTTIVTLLQMLGLALALYQTSQKEASPFHWGDVQTMFLLGVPIGLQLLAEGGMFGLVTMLMGHFGSGALGGHQVALQIASFSFTVCLGISAATSVRVGMAFGNQDPTRARRAGISGMALSGSFMALSGLMLWLTAPQLARFFATPPDVQAAAVSFLGIAAVFQVFDGLQAVASGAIRGTGKTQLAFWLNVASHWGCGVPTALFLAYGMGWKGEGLWWGLTAGLVAGSIVISAAFLPLTRPSHTSRIA